MTHLRIGTRGSELALYQARTVAARLEALGVASEVVVIRTSGDRLGEASLSEIGGKRLFVKEIEDALLAGTVELAVHSSKDMPADLPDGLEIGAVLPREDPRDAIVLPAGSPGEHAIEDVIRILGQTPRIGTSSIRRVAQLARLFPGATFLPVRGNVQTRLAKLDAGNFDALVLAAAGLRRLELVDRISTLIPPAACVPAPGQGIIAIEIRSDASAVRDVVTRIDDRAAALALVAERAVVKRLGGGCQMPIGAFAELAGDAITVTGIVISPDGETAAHGKVTGQSGDAVTVGAEVAAQLLADGAGVILADVQRQQAAVEEPRP